MLHPLIRTGAKGAGEFRQATWGEALELVRDRVEAVIAEHGPAALVGWGSAGNQGLVNQAGLSEVFFGSLGATRLTGALCGAVAGAGVAATYGTGRCADPTDVAHAELVILWGTNTRLTNRHLWPFVEQARAKGAPVWVIDPIRTITAEAADEFVQPRPGADVALMLAIMHVLVRDGLVDHGYVREHATGFGDLAEHVASWTPAHAATVCGVDAAVIERLAAAYGATKRSFIRTLIGAEHQDHGGMFFRTLACLPVLTGAWRERGGGLARSVGSWSDPLVDERAFAVAADAPRTLPFTQIGQWLADPAAGVHAVFVWNGNPAVSAPNSAGVRAGLARDDVFVVVSEQFCTDTARYADVIFPAATQLEQLDVVPAWGHTYLGWNEPAIEPLGEAVPNTELWRRLARTFGLDDPRFALDDLALVRHALNDLVDVDALRERGFVQVPMPDGPIYAEGGFATADGKAMLRNDGLASFGAPGLPSVPDPLADPAHPFVLQTPKTAPRFLNSTYSHHHAAREPEPCVELAEADAAALGVADGHPVRVHNEAGALVLPVRVSARTQPGVVLIPWGWWGDAVANDITSDAHTDWGGGVAYLSTRVAIEAVPHGA